MRLVPVSANGQPAFGVYLQHGDTYEAFAIQVLTMAPEGVSHVAMFFDLGLFVKFSLPGALPARDRAFAGK